MLRYIIKRLLSLLPLLLVVSFFVFMFIHFIPGDPARLMAGQDAGAEEIENARNALGLNDPILVQYTTYLSSLLQLELGESYRSGIPVIDLISDRIGPSLLLTFFSILWALVIGILVGIISAVFRDRLPDRLEMLTAVSGISLPNFWLGLVAIQIFSVQLGWLPTGGINDGLKSYILLSFALGAGIMAMIARFTRSSLVHTLKQDYIRTGRSIGLSGQSIIYGHALKNSLIPVITVAGLQFGFLLGGSVVVETDRKSVV